MIKSTITLALLAVLAVVVLLLLNLPSDESSREPAPAAPHVAGSSGRPAAEDTAIALDEAESPRLEVELGDLAPAAGAVEFELHVVRASDEPAAGARVWFFEISTDERRERFMTVLAENADYYADAVLSLGEEVTADEQGVVRHHFRVDGLLALAKLEDERGNLEWEPGDTTPATIRLREVSELSVRVLDAASQSRGEIPIHFGFRRSSFYSGGTRRAVSRESDGIAHFPTLPRARREGDVPATEAFLAAGIVQLEPDWQPISLDPWPSEPVKLTLPATGEVLIEVAGLPPEARSWCELGIRKPGRSRGRMITGASVTMPLEEGEALFPLVGLGLELQVEVNLPGSGSGHSGQLTGPVRSGERRTLRIDLGSNTVLVGRLLGQGGEPVGKGRWRIKVLSEGLSSGMTLETDADGRFRFVLSDKMQRSELKSLSIEPRRAPETEEPGVPLEAAADLPPTLGPGTYDLGDLYMKEPPVLAAGRVQDHTGAPVAGARVYLMQLMYRPPTDGQEHWTNARTIEESIRTGEDGEFRCHGRVRGDSPELRVHAEREGYFQPEPLPCGLGSEGLIVVLQQSGAIAYELLPPEGMGLRQLPEMKLIPTGGDGGALRRAPSRRELKGELWDSIPPGTYTLSLHHDCALDPLLEIPEIVVSPNQTTRDPRLLPLDFGTTLRMVRILVLDSAGAPFEESLSFIHVHEMSSGGGGQPRQADGSYLISSCIADPAALLVCSDGYRSVHLEKLDRDREVVMTDRIGVTLSLTALPPRQPEGGFVGLELRRSRTGSSLDHHLKPEVEGDPGTTQELRAFFHAPGTYDVVWKVGERQESGSRQYSTHKGGEVEISELDDGGVVELTPPAEIMNGDG